MKFCCVDLAQTRIAMEDTIVPSPSTTPIYLDLWCVDADKIEEQEF